MKKLVAVLIFVFTSGLAYAGGGYTSWGKVTKIDNAWDGYVVFFTGATHVGLDVPCNRPEVRILTGSEFEDKMFSIALTALISGNEIRARVDGCSGSYQQATFIGIR